MTKEMTNPFPLPNPPTAIPCSSARMAIQIIGKAHKADIPASYHPKGGYGQKKYTPPTHTVWVWAEEEKVRKFIESLEKKNAETENQATETV